MDQYRLNCNKCTTLMQDVINRRSSGAGVGEAVEEVGRNSVLPNQFFYKPKITLKKSLFI